MVLVQNAIFYFLFATKRLLWWSFILSSLKYSLALSAIWSCDSHKLWCIPVLGISQLFDRWSLRRSICSFRKLSSLIRSYDCCVIIWYASYLWFNFQIIFDHWLTNTDEFWYLCVTKVFDQVEDKGPDAKLSSHTLHPAISFWMSYFLSNRIVVVNGAESQPFPMNSGTLQNSTFACPLIHQFINNILIPALNPFNFLQMFPLSIVPVQVLLPNTSCRTWMAQDPVCVHFIIYFCSGFNLSLEHFRPRISKCLHKIFPFCFTQAFSYFLAILFSLDIRSIPAIRSSTRIILSSLLLQHVSALPENFCFLSFRKTLFRTFSLQPTFAIIQSSNLPDTRLLMAGFA